MLTLKVVFLLTIVSARRVSELAALSVASALVSIHRDRVVLRPDPSFVPKVDTIFHRSAEVVLPSFLPAPSTSQEHSLHTLDARRAFLYYLDRTASFRRSDSLFVLFYLRKRGHRASPSTISRWVREAIADAYKAQDLVPPEGIIAHSTRAVSTSTAFRSFPSLEQVCRAATWSVPHTFIRHYRIDLHASRDVEFGRSVLRSALRQASPSSSHPA